MLELLREGHGLESWAPRGDISQMRLDGNDLVVAVDRNDAELARRRERRIGTLTNRRALRVLLSMPKGIVIPLNFMSENDLRVLHALPAGMVEITESDVRVLISPAVSLLSVGVIARTWKQGLRLSSPYAAYCARYVVLDQCGSRHAAQNLSMAMVEARYFGVGLAEHRPGHVEWLVSPAPFAADRYSDASWLMAERLTESML